MNMKMNKIHWFHKGYDTTCLIQEKELFPQSSLFMDERLETEGVTHLFSISCNLLMNQDANLSLSLENNHSLFPLSMSE